VVAGDLSFDPIEEADRQWRAHGWGDAAPGMGVVTSIMRAQQVLLARADAVLGTFGLTFARFEVLTLLSFTREGCLPMGKLGSRLQVHPASVTSAVDRLERQGFVRREAHPTDGRATLAVLTDEGRAVAADAAVRLNTELFAELGLTEPEATTLFALLARLRQ
jgi:DNA-binding MarR family transcriptional regulator